MKSTTEMDFTENITIEGDKYLVQTEDMGPKKHVVVTTILLKGKIVSTKKTDYRDKLSELKDKAQINALLAKLHKEAIEEFEKVVQEELSMTTKDYLELARNLVKEKKRKEAFEILDKGLGRFPDDPFILSLHGLLNATFNKERMSGIRSCRKAIDALEKKVPFGADYYYPGLYINLGRACLAAKDKKEAMEAFLKGLQYDAENKELQNEVKKLGKRRKPFIPFLDRSHPLNVNIGKFLSKLGR